MGGRSNSDSSDKTAPTTEKNISGNNDSVIYGDKGFINSGIINNITTEKYTTKIKVNIEYDDYHISEMMARKLQVLVKEIVELEEKVKNHLKHIKQSGRF